MGVIEVKDQLRSLTSAERREVTAFLFELQSEEDEETELARLHTEMNSGKRVSLADCLAAHEAKLKEGR